MKQTRVVLTRSPENSSTKLPIFIRLYSPRGGARLLEYTEGAVPFFAKWFQDSDSTLYGANATLFAALSTQRRKVDRGYITQSFWVYNVSDYGSQSLSPGLSDFLPLCFDSTGRKIPQYRTSIVKNYTSKETFILIPKEGEVSEPQIKVIIEFRDLSKGAQEFVLTRSQGGTFQVNLSTSGVNSIEDLAFFAKEGDTYLEIPATEYGAQVTPPANGYTGSLVAEQSGYFEKLLTGSAPNKVYHNVTLSLSDNLRDVNTIYCRSRKNSADYYYLSGTSLLTLPVIGGTQSIDIYEENEGTGLLSRLVPGVDFYVGSDGLIKLQGSAAQMYEVFPRPENLREISLPFTAYVGSMNAFNDKEALYHRYFPDWDYTSADKIMFKGGLLQGYVGSSASGYSGSMAAGDYEYLLYNIVHSQNGSAPASDTNTVAFTNSEATFYPFTKYQSPMDPLAINYDQVQTSGASNREVEFYIQDKSEGFRLYTGSSAREPYVQYVGSNSKILELTDPYPALLQGAISYVGSRGVQGYTGHQGYTGSQGVQSELVNRIRGSAPQAIETNIQKAKRNIKAMAKNSGLAGYSSVTSSAVAERNFMFLVVKGTYNAGDNPKFNISYRSAGSVIKKEYACELDSEGYYVSLPFFLDELGGSTVSIDSFEIEKFNSAHALTYRVFK